MLKGQDPGFWIYSLLDCIGVKFRIEVTLITFKPCHWNE